MIDISKIFKIGKEVVKDEVQEIVNLKPTDEDYEQGEKLAAIGAAAMAGMGLPIPALGITVMSKAFAYGIRDLKDGVEDHDKLIIKRIINEVKGIKEEETESKQGE